jgi:hypothetical protein
MTYDNRSDAEKLVAWTASKKRQRQRDLSKDQNALEARAEHYGIVSHTGATFMHPGAGPSIDVTAPTDDVPFVAISTELPRYR